ncbi:ArnT family glycosyltransferase [Verrucomicrobiota bacterium]
MKSGENKNYLFDPAACVLWLLLILGLIVRVARAWSVQMSPKSDYGIVALMAKHMAEGVDFPIFFYGQPYMGSFEPMISGILCKIFGSTGFIVCLGTSLLGFFALPLIYIWARDAFDKKAGLAALLFSIIGSDTYFHYSTAPRGGYMSLLVAGLLTIWLTNKIAGKTIRNEKVSMWTYVLLGLSAGIGWWSHQLMIVYLLYSAIIFILIFRTRIINKGTLLATTGFLLGSMPWLLWNFMNSWTSLSFKNSLGSTPLNKGFHNFIIQFSRTAGLTSDKPVLYFIHALFLLSLLVLFLITLSQNTRKGLKSEQSLNLLSPLLIIILLGIIYTPTHFSSINASRYLLPAFPAIAVMIGVSTRWLDKKLPLRSGWIPLVILISGQWYMVPGMKFEFEQTVPVWQKAEKLSGFAKENKIDVLSGVYLYHWMNFASKEELCVSDLCADKYAPYEKSRATSESCGFLNNPGNISDFAEQTLGTFSNADVEGFSILYNLQPPTTAWKYLAPEEIKSITDHVALDIKNKLTDLNMDTAWQTYVDSPSSAKHCHIDFRKTVKTSGIRIHSLKNLYPGRIRIEGLTDKSNEWIPLIDNPPITKYFWSGPRVYWQGLQYFSEYRWSPVETSAIRIIISPIEGRNYKIALSEMAILVSSDNKIPAEYPVADVISYIKAHNIKKLYAPRFVSEAIYKEIEHDVEISVPSLYKRKVWQLPKTDPTGAIHVSITTNTAMLISRQDALYSEKCLNKLEFQSEKTEIGPWILFDFKKDSASEKLEEERKYPALCWTESGCYLRNSISLGKHVAAPIFAKAQISFKAKDTDKTIKLLQKAIHHYPLYKPAITMLRDIAISPDIKNESEKIWQEYSDLTTPGINAPIEFKKKIVFLGLTLEKNKIRKNDKFLVDYFWKCPTSVEIDNFAVFVHFKNEQADFQFQDDHVLMEGIEKERFLFQPFEETFKIRREVRVPDQAPEGIYELVFGIYNRSTGKKIPAKTSLKNKNNKTTLPITLELEQ